MSKLRKLAVCLLCCTRLPVFPLPPPCLRQPKNASHPAPTIFEGLPPAVKVNLLPVAVQALPIPLLLPILAIAQRVGAAPALRSRRAEWGSRKSVTVGLGRAPPAAALLPRAQSQLASTAPLCARAMHGWDPMRTGRPRTMISKLKEQEQHRQLRWGLDAQGSYQKLALPPPSSCQFFQWYLTERPLIFFSFALLRTHWMSMSPTLTLPRLHTIPTPHPTQCPIP